MKVWHFVSESKRNCCNYYYYSYYYAFIYVLFHGSLCVGIRHGKAAMDVCSPVNFLTGSALAERCNHELVWYCAHYWFALITSWSDVWIHRRVCWSWKRFPKRKESLGKSWWTRGSFVLKESPIWVLEMCFFFCFTWRKSVWLHVFLFDMKLELVSS